VLGGAATMGNAAHGDAFSTPGRLEARLRIALPGIEVRVSTRAGARRSALATLRELDADIVRTEPSLVIWNAGAIEAGRGTDLDQLTNSLQTGIERIREARADIILVDLQYAPSIARIIDLAPYRDAILGVAAANDVPVLDRYELMRDWSSSGLLDLDATAPTVRVEVARRLFDCIAAALAAPIASAVLAPAPP
jgi:hypothetical protein